jgi:hypothetical protein
MTNNDIFKLVNFIIRKDKKGNPDIVNNFERLLQQANSNYFKEEFNVYQANQNVNDTLSPFEVRLAINTLTTTATTITLPTDYAHFIGMYWTDSNSYDRSFDLVTDDQWDMRLGSTLTVPSDNYPVCKVLGNKLYVNPNMIVFSDWFLPSKDELEQMYINLANEGVGGFSDALYWSSSESSSSLSWRVQMIVGSPAIDVSPKSAGLRVRACRTFTDDSGQYSLRDVGPGGGLVFYISGITHYEAAASDQSTGSAWSNVNSTLIGTTGTDIGDGVQNTLDIINQAGHTASAAKLCNDLN